MGVDDSRVRFVPIFAVCIVWATVLLCACSWNPSNVTNPLRPPGGGSPALWGLEWVAVVCWVLAVLSVVQAVRAPSPTGFSCAISLAGCGVGAYLLGFVLTRGTWPLVILAAIGVGVLIYQRRHAKKGKPLGGLFGGMA